MPSLRWEDLGDKVLGGRAAQLEMLLDVQVEMLSDTQMSVWLSEGIPFWTYK